MGLADRYEALRFSGAASLERNLFVQSGMVAWMEAWSEFGGRSDTEHRWEDKTEGCESACFGREQQSPGNVRDQVAEIIAGMAWASLRR